VFTTVRLFPEILSYQTTTHALAPSDEEIFPVPIRKYILPRQLRAVGLAPSLGKYFPDPHIDANPISEFSIKGDTFRTQLLKINYGFDLDLRKFILAIERDGKISTYELSKYGYESVHREGPALIAKIDERLFFLTRVAKRLGAGISMVNVLVDVEADKFTVLNKDDNSVEWAETVEYLRGRTDTDNHEAMCDLIHRLDWPMVAQDFDIHCG